jgi:aspartyl-tRNA(Asn)/glutamyl-tRNA(Gln) amidotransferase subunit A
VAVPVGLDAEGLPRAVQIIAAQGADALALRGARVIERAARIGVPG